MSEHITHTAICDDTRRLCIALPYLPQAFKHAWASHIDVSRMGGVTRHADKWSAAVIDHLRQHPTDPDHDKKLAFILGALSHRSIDRHMKPVFTYFKQSIDARIVQGQVINECTIYCDMLILQKVFALDSTFSPRLFDSALTTPTKPFHELLRATFQRVLMQMHTFKPDDANVHDWMSKLFAGMQDFNLRLDLYDQIAANPDPEKWKRYLLDTNFYNDADPLVVLLRQLHQNQPAADVQRMLDATSPSHSLYARAVARAVDYIRAAADLYQGKITVEQALPRMDIGVPELALEYRPPLAT
jgi:hypothetical protein